MSGPTATVVADSLSIDGHRLTTMEVKLHHYVAKELLTHRKFSRGAASHRAIPLAKTIESLRRDPAIPPSFGTVKPGMQAGPPLDGEDAVLALGVWLNAMDDAIEQAKKLDTMGVHKSLTNRLLEPFAWATYVITATDWEGFFYQRCHEDAEEALRLAALVMRDAMVDSVPRLATSLPRVAQAPWHLPYVHLDEIEECWRRSIDPRRISVARVARVSYLNHHGERDLDEDAQLFLRLVERDPMHAGPLEHVATPAGQWRQNTANLRGWVNLRTLMGH